MKGLFEKATRLKIRFETVVGNLSVEDLWDLPLISENGGPNLDDVAKRVNKQLKEVEEESFVVKTQNRQRDLLKLKLDIVKYIINTKLEEQKAREEEAVKKAKKEKILRIIQMKEEKELMDMDLDELKSMVESM